MGRKLRSWIPDQSYHVVCRGNRRDPLFHDSTDFSTFLYILQQIHHERAPFELSSYCLMTNHFHLQLRSQAQPISKIMALLNKRYANYYNTRFNLTGHVFEKRYYSKIIYPGQGMLEVSRYIHLNPVKAGIVKSPEEYPWSSYYLYQDDLHILEVPEFINLDLVYGKFPGTNRHKQKSYRQFIYEKDTTPQDQSELHYYEDFAPTKTTTQKP